MLHVAPAADGVISGKNHSASRVSKHKHKHVDHEATSVEENGCLEYCKYRLHNMHNVSVLTQFDRMSVVGKQHE